MGPIGEIADTFSSLDLENVDDVRGLMKFFNTRKKTFTVSIEGNIGCGKSTMLEYFETFSDTVEAIKEPVKLWTDLKGHNAMQYLYDDPERWSFMFNQYSYLTRVEMHSTKTMLPVRMLERSLYSTRHVFIENAFKQGFLSGVEHAVLSDWFTFVTSTQNINVDLFVYLQASPEVCYERIKKRDRKEETNVPFGFIQDLHNLHEEWLLGERSVANRPAPVLVLDASHEIAMMEKVYEEHRPRILCGCS